MSNELVIARRYSAALDACLKSEKDVDKAISEIEEFRQVLQGSEELGSILFSPFRNPTEKIGVLSAVLKKMKLSSKVTNFLLVLQKNGRLDLFETVLQELVYESDERLGRDKAQVVSASELEDAERKKLKAGMEKMIGKKLELDFQTDAELLGGFVVQTKNKIFDYSVKGQLERLEDLVHKMRVW